MLIQCWFNVYNAGPVLTQHWAIVWCMAGGDWIMTWQMCTCPSEKNKIMKRKIYLAVWGRRPANTRQWTNVGLMLAQCRRRWANIKPVLIQFIVFAGYFSSGMSREKIQNGCSSSIVCVDFCNKFNHISWCDWCWARMGGGGVCRTDNIQKTNVLEEIVFFFCMKLKRDLLVGKIPTMFRTCSEWSVFATYNLPVVRVYGLL